MRCRDALVDDFVNLRRDKERNRVRRQKEWSSHGCICPNRRCQGCDGDHAQRRGASTSAVPIAARQSAYQDWQLRARDDVVEETSSLTYFDPRDLIAWQILP